MASKEKRVGQTLRSTPGETTPTSLTASGSRAPQSGPTSTTRRLRAPFASDSEHRDSGSGSSEYEDPVTFRKTETCRKVKNNPLESEAIEIDPPAPEPSKVTYFFASLLQRTRSAAYPSTSTPAHTNLPPPPVTTMVVAFHELKGLGKPDPFRGDPSDYSWMSTKTFITRRKRRLSFFSHIWKEEMQKGIRPYGWNKRRPQQEQEPLIMELWHSSPKVSKMRSKKPTKNMTPCIN